MGRSHSAMATRAIILLFLAAIVTIWADTAEVQILENALDNTPSPVSGSAAIELEDDRLGEDDNMGAGRSFGFTLSSTASYGVSSGRGGQGPGGEEAAYALLEEDESAMVGSSVKWEAFFTVDKANKAKNNKTEQAAWAEYGKYQGLNNRTFPRLESLHFRQSYDNGTPFVVATVGHPHRPECALTYRVNVMTAAMSKETCKGPLIKATSEGTQGGASQGGASQGVRGGGRRLLAARRDCNKWSMRANKAAENYFSNLRAAAAKKMTDRCKGGRGHHGSIGLGEDDNMGAAGRRGGFLLSTSGSFGASSGRGGHGPGGEEAAYALLEEDEDGSPDSEEDESENDWEEFLTRDKLEPNFKDKGKGKKSQERLSDYGILAGAGPLSLHKRLYNKPAPQDLQKKGKFTMVRIKGEVKVNNTKATCWMNYFITIKQRVIANPNPVTCGSQPLLKNDDFGLVSGDRSGNCKSWLPSAAKAARDFFSRYNLQAMNKAAKSCRGRRRGKKK